MDMFEDDEDITDDLPMDVHLDTLSHIVVDNHADILDIYPSVCTSHSPWDHLEPSWKEISLFL